MLTSTLTTITPDMARAMLEKTPPHQRTVTWSRVNRLAADMKEGRFVTTGQTITLDWDGNVVDGQHRLHAIANSGIPADIILVTGEDPEHFGQYDIGLQRTAAQFLEGKYRSITKSAAEFVMLYEQNPNMPQGAHAHAHRAWTIQEVVAAVAEKPGLIELAPAVSIAYKATRIHKPTLLAVTYLGGKHAPDLVEPWLYGITTGADLTPNDPRLALRNVWTRNYRMLNLNPGRRQSWAYIVRAWNAFVNDEPVKLLRYNPDHPMPPITGTVA